MADTLGQILAYINAIYPNKMGSTMMISIINDEQRHIYRHMPEKGVADITTVADQPYINLPSNCRYENIIELLVSDTTATITSTANFTAYLPAGIDDEMSGGNYYYDYWGVSGKVGIYPVSTSGGYKGRILYEKRPYMFSSTAEVGVEFDLDDDWLDVLKFRTIARIAKSGNSPDVEMGNNYDREAYEIEHRLKLDRSRKNVKSIQRKWSYREGWNA